MITFQDLWPAAQSPAEALAKGKRHAEIWAAVELLGDPSLDVRAVEALALEARDRGEDGIKALDGALGLLELATLVLEEAPEETR